ncbi:MAG: selenocysteine-specific translation elongation factor [Ktedonobacteraceae bacterium]
MSCIGTAGHVDHGKSTLVKALTGIDPDRLIEEKERGMTIDLGFAWLKLPGGQEVSIVDVPGHESFIKNMLAGVGGIDAALLVIAADEGVMPQTREHLAILDLLRVQRGIVALTKADLVDDEWLELVREEIAEQLLPTTLASAPIIPVSAYTKQGLPTLLSALEQMLNEAQEQQNIARPRLPIDRVFSMTGFGTIVTGTLLDGSFKIGQEVEVLPQGFRTRIRSLQTHQHGVDIAQPGSRVAINLASISRTELARGDVVAQPGQLRTTQLVDAYISLLNDAPHPLAHNTLVDFYSGSQEVPAKVRLLDVEELQPGQSAWVQLRLSRPAVLVRRDRFILRIPSPSTTIGGGAVVEVQPRYHRRFQPSVLKRLSTLEQGAPEELVLATLDRRTRIVGVAPASTKAAATKSKSPTAKSNATKGLIGYELTEIVKQSNLAQDVTQQTLETLLTERRVRKVGTLWFAQSVWEALVEETTRLLSEQHRQYPLRSGLSKEEWRTRLGLASRMAMEIFPALLSEGVVAEAAGGSFIRLPHFEPHFTQAEQQQVAQLLQRFRESPYAPPGRTEVETQIGTETLNALIEQGHLMKLGDGILFLRETYDQAIAILVQYLQTHDKMTVAEARDVLGATRKYILPLLEHMDALKITRRIGDERMLSMQIEKSD